MKNCDRQETGNEDNESLMEKCWEERYKGDSRKWLIRDASAKIAKGHLCSTMKDSFLYPRKEKCNEMNMGKRKALLLRKFYDDATAEIIRERESSPEPNDYCTEYDGNFKSGEFQPDNEFYKKNAEAFQKYPLYSSAPVSYYSFNIQKSPAEVPHGLTKISNPTNIFKRNGQFTKPLSECLDNVEL